MKAPCPFSKLSPQEREGRMITAADKGSHCVGSRQMLFHLIRAWSERDCYSILQMKWRLRVSNEPKCRLTASSQGPDSYAIQTPVLSMSYCTTRDA